MKKIYSLAILLSFCFSFAFGQEGGVVVLGNARFSFITPSLVRMEYAEKGKFLDDSTLFAVNRTQFYDSVTVETRPGNLYIMRTPKMRVEYQADGFPFGQVNLKVYFTHKGREQRWYMASSQSENLRGALYTLDGLDGATDLDEGLLSRDGWYVINDTGRDIIKNGWIASRPREHVQDIYLFVYGTDYKAALRSLRAIGGAVPMTRKYVHGSWYCRWWDYSQAEFMDIARGYAENDFPLDILVLDMGWHTQKQATVGTGHAGRRGWTGYTWDRTLIPEPEKLISTLKKDRISVVINEHPHDGIRPHDSMYGDFMRLLGKDSLTDAVPLFDAGSREYMNAFFKTAHRTSDNMGLGFWWLDWQQDYLYPLVRGTNTRHINWINHLWFEDSKQGGLRGAGFSRWAGWGDHRHPIQFSGDAVASWESLKFQVKMTATSGNSGCFFWAHDIGGFYGGSDPEMYVRWTQFGLLNSSMRIHSVLDPKLDRRPWLWGKREAEAMRKSYHMRSELMPYIYSTVRQSSTEMLPLVRAMYIEYPEIEQAYRSEQQFLFGDLLLAAPITSKGEGADRVATQNVWLPKGDLWYGVFDSKLYPSGEVAMSVSTPLESFPLYVKGGYPIPMQPYTARMASDPIDTLRVVCYPGIDGRKGSYELYEDDGMTTQYEEGRFATTKLEYSKNGERVVVKIHSTIGTYDGQLSERVVVVELPGATYAKRAKVNGANTSTIVDQKNNRTYVTVKRSSIRKEITVELTQM